MIVFDEDAHKKRCCGPSGCGAKDSAAGTSEAEFRYCVGADCMGWRVAHMLSVNNPSNITGQGQHIDTSHGYCGLAGKP